jgi:hypothetical protein
VIGEQLLYCVVQQIQDRLAAVKASGDDVVQFIDEGE